MADRSPNPDASQSMRLVNSVSVLVGNASRSCAVNGKGGTGRPRHRQTCRRKRMLATYRKRQGSPSSAMEDPDGTGTITLDCLSRLTPALCPSNLGRTLDHPINAVANSGFPPTALKLVRSLSDS